MIVHEIEDMYQTLSHTARFKWLKNTVHLSMIVGYLVRRKKSVLGDTDQSMTQH